MTATAAKQLLESQWYYLSVEEVTRHLESDLELGLTANEVVQRQQRFGANEFKSKPGKSPWLRFIGQFNQPLLYILLIAGAIKALLGSWVNAWVIWGVTVITAIIGYVQFEWVQESTENIDLARTMAIQSLVAGRIFYLLSISQLGSDFIGKLQRLIPLQQLKLVLSVLLFYKLCSVN